MNKIPALSTCFSSGLFCVIIHYSNDNNKLPLKFIITDQGTLIAEFINHRRPHYHIKAFTRYYDANNYLKKKLSYEDKFHYQISDDDMIPINNWNLHPKE